MWGSQEKILGQKVNVKFFRIDPYTLGIRIQRAFHEGATVNFFYLKYGGIRKKIWGKKSMKNFSG